MNIKYFTDTLTILSTSLILLSVTLLNAQDFTITGQVLNVNKGQISLTPYESETEDINQLKLSTTLDEQGRFTLNGNIVQTILGKLTYQNEDEEYIAKIFVEPGNIEVELDVAKYPGSGLAETTKLMGTANNMLLLEGRQREQQFMKNHNFDKAKELNAKISLAKQDPATSEKLLDSLQLASTMLSDKYYRDIIDLKMNLYKETKGSLALFFLLTREGVGINSGLYSLHEQQEFLALADKETRASYYYQAYKKELANKMLLQPGMTAPVFSLKNNVGEEISLLDYRGKYVLIDFWAYYCAPCIKAFPKMQDLLAQYADKGFEILSISTDLDDKKWRQALEKHKNTWPQLIDKVHPKDDSITLITDELYHISSIPTYFLIDDKGKIVASGIDQTSIFTKIREIFTTVSTK